MARGRPPKASITPEQRAEASRVAQAYRALLHLSQQQLAEQLRLTACVLCLVERADRRAPTKAVSAVLALQ